MKKINNTTAGASSSMPPPPPPPPPPPRPLRAGLPPGYRFKPSDIEAMHLLRHKIETGASLMPEIKDIALYQYSPETLARMYAPLGDNEWYFFTSTRRKHPTAKRADRLAGDGFWRAMTAVKEVKHGEQTVGKKHTLVYHTGKNKDGERTCWLMHEYRVEGVHVPTHANDMMLADWVLCKIYKNARTVKAEQRRQMEGIVIGRAPAAAGYEEFNDGDEEEDDYSRELTDPQLQGFHHHPPFPNKAAAKFNNGDAGYSRALTNQRQGFLHHQQSPYQSMLPNQAAAGFNNGDAGYSRPLTNQRQGFLHHPQSTYQSMLPNQAAAGFNNGDAGYSRALTNQRQGFLHHPQSPNQSMLPNQAAAAGFNNGGEYSRAVINPRKRSLHHPHEYPNQTMLFNRTAAAEFNNGGSTSSGCMTMAGQRHHHHHDPTINPIYQLAGAGAREFHNSGEGCSKMAEVSDMGEMFNPRNYYNPHLDQPSLFNAYANHHHQAEGSHRVDKGKAPIYYPNLDQYSSLPSSSNAGAQAQAQAQVASEERLNNGGGKATTSNDQECYRPAPPPDQVQVPSDKNNSSAINGEGNIEGFSMNERGYCMINGERVEMGEDFMTTSMAEAEAAAAALHSPPNFNTTDFPNWDYYSILDDYDYNDITGS